jgi:hypothetical protein
MVKKNLKIGGKNEGLSEICWGGNGKRWKGVFLFPSIGHQALEPSRAAKHWNLSRPLSNGTFQGPPNTGTFHWSLSWDLPSPPSSSFSLKGKFESFGVLFFRHNFQFESWKYLFLQLSLGGEQWLVLVDGGKRKNKDDCGTFERMEVSKDNVGSLKSYKNFTNPLEFCNTFFYWFGCRTWNLLNRCAL